MMSGRREELENWRIGGVEKSKVLLSQTEGNSGLNEFVGKAWLQVSAEIRVPYKTTLFMIVVVFRMNYTGMPVLNSGPIDSINNHRDSMEERCYYYCSGVLVRGGGYN